MGRLCRAFLALTLLVMPASGASPLAAPPENSVAGFLGHAEMQVETESQRGEIRHVLQDMLDTPADRLRLRRYPDYQGRPSAWQAPVVLRHYFVPDPPQALDPAAFYRDYSKAEAQRVIRQRLDELARIR